MSRQGEHTKLIGAAAREVLRPLGIVQKGRSRTWLDDQGWWLGVVEFQPSSWSRGSYLNVGVTWLWNVTAHLGFDVGGRVTLPDQRQFVTYTDAHQFEPLARQLSLAAATRVERQRALFGTVQAAAASLREIPASDLRASLDAGVALGLAGDAPSARAMFARFTRWYESERAAEARESQRARYRRAQLLSESVGDESRFSEQIRADITATRRLLKLGEVTLPF